MSACRVNGCVSEDRPGMPKPQTASSSRLIPHRQRATHMPRRPRPCRASASTRDIPACARMSHRREALLTAQNATSCFGARSALDAHAESTITWLSARARRLARDATGRLSWQRGPAALPPGTPYACGRCVASPPSAASAVYGQALGRLAGLHTACTDETSHTQKRRRRCLCRDAWRIATVHTTSHPALVAISGEVQFVRALVAPHSPAVCANTASASPQTATSVRRTVKSAALLVCSSCRCCRRVYCEGKALRLSTRRPLYTSTRCVAPGKLLIQTSTRRSMRSLALSRPWTSELASACTLSCGTCTWPR